MPREDTICFALFNFLQHSHILAKILFESKYVKIAFGFRTSSSKIKQCAQARRILRIRLRIQAKQRGRGFDTPHSFDSSFPFCTKLEWLYDSARTYFIKNS